MPRMMTSSANTSAITLVILELPRSMPAMGLTRLRMSVEPAYDQGLPHHQWQQDYQLGSNAAEGADDVQDCSEHHHIQEMRRSVERAFLAGGNHCTQRGFQEDERQRQQNEGVGNNLRRRKQH